MIVGESGVSPEYFLYKMRWWEVDRIIAGVRRRYRSTYETSRHLEWVLIQMFGDKKEKHKLPATPMAFYKFPWEKDDVVLEKLPEETEEERKLMQELSSGYNWQSGKGNQKTAIGR